MWGTQKFLKLLQKNPNVVNLTANTTSISPLKVPLLWCDASEPRSRASCDFSCISSTIVIHFPFTLIFNSGNKKKSQGVRSVEYDGWGTITTWFLVINLLGWSWSVHRCIVTGTLLLISEAELKLREKVQDKVAGEWLAGWLPWWLVAKGDERRWCLTQLAADRSYLSIKYTVMLTHFLCLQTLQGAFVSERRRDQVRIVLFA